MHTRELYLGLMSGTSLDAIDAVLMDFSGTPRMIACESTSLAANLREEIRALNSPQENELTRALVLGKELAILFSQAVLSLLEKNRIDAREVSAIGSHGQTLRHAPNGFLGYSLQIGDPSTIAELTGITVVADFRNRDIAAGGQGAPLVPAFHQAVFSNPAESRAIINIGGMANASIFLKDGTVMGFDTGPGNVLMNHWIGRTLNKEYDVDGAWAHSGTVDQGLLQCMLDDPFFHLPPPKSTGREKFDAHWLAQLRIANLKAEDVQATLLELTAASISMALPEEIDQIFVCGGGAYNSHLMQRLESLCGKPVMSTEILGIKPEWVEAAAFAWLARQTLNHLPGNLPAATGAKGPRVLGGIYPAR